MPPLRISLFGKLSMQWRDQTTLHIESRRAQELLCYLLLYRDRMHEREKLATVLWGDKDATQAKRYLRQILWQAQATLNTVAQEAEPLLLVAHERIGINPQAAYWLDVAVLEQTFAQVEQIPSRALTKNQAELLQKTVPLYTSDLLEDWYYDWCIYERERYQSMYLALLDKLLAYSEAQQTYEAGFAYGAQILRYDRAREQTHRQLMRLYYLAGDRTAALHQYEACVNALREELNVEPSKSTITLYKRICAEQISIPALAGEEAAHHLAPAHASLDTLHQLEQVQTALAHLQAQVTQLIQGLNHQTLHQD